MNKQDREELRRQIWIDSNIVPGGYRCQNCSIAVVAKQGGICPACMDLLWRAEEKERREAEIHALGTGFIIIVARNNIQLTKLAVKSALAQDMPCEVLLIDNRSSDGSVTWTLTRNFPTILLMQQHSLAACWNMGLAAAWRLGEHALVCNNDIELRPDTYRTLLSHGGPFVTCVSVDSLEQMNAPRDPDYDYTLTQRLHPDFSCFLIRKQVTDRVGWFNEDYYPAYAEDAEYHVRMHRAGIEALCIDLPFLHHGASTLKYSVPGEQARIERGAAANRERFKRMYGCYPGTKEYEALFSD